VPDPARDIARAADALAARGLLADAIEQYDRAIELRPGDARLFYQLGLCQWRLGRPAAGASFRKATEADPRFAVAHGVLSAWYFQHQLVELADQSSQTAMALSPGEHSVLHARATVLEATGRLAEAAGLLEPIVASTGVQIAVVRLYGRLAVHQGVGHQTRALKIIQQQLAVSKRGTIDRARLHFTAGELLDKMARYDDAFAHVAAGNQLARPPYTPAVHERSFDTLTSYFTRPKLASLPRASDLSDKPVFIVGMPRSGTSLVEQILASHPAIHGGGELDFLSHVWAGTIGMNRSKPQEYPFCLDRLTADQADGMSEIYLRPLAALNPAASRLTDKLPLNSLHLGLISMLMPGARVIDVRRDPRDTCLSCYFSLFDAGNDFKFDLEHTAHFLLQTDRLMRHWRQVLDLPILEVSYEAIVADPETQTRRMLAFLGLPWDDACLRFHKTERPNLTSSRQQVRQPMYASSVGRWRNYQRHLGVLDKWFGKPTSPAEPPKNCF
jgi:Flp pilus assembly protein TadD